MRIAFLCAFSFYSTYLIMFYFYFPEINVSQFVLLIGIAGINYWVTADEDLVFANGVGVLLTPSQYCFVSESTIRINDSEVKIINNTGDWIMAGNNINLFMAPANGTNCTSTTSSVAPHSDTIYIFRIVIYVATTLLILANIALHIFIKELQTISGVLIVLLCTFILLLTVLLLVRNALAGQRDSELCAVLFYAKSFLYFLYDTSKLSMLIHFNYLMYHSYKASKVILRTKSILFKYVTFIVILSIIFSATFILVDIFVSRTAFKTIHGRCTLLIGLSNYGNISIIFCRIVYS